MGRSLRRVGRGGPRPDLPYCRVMSRVRAISAAGVTAAALVVIALAILLLANEVRYQGCVARIDRVSAMNAAAEQPVAVPPACSRLPFAAG